MARRYIFLLNVNIPSLVSRTNELVTVLAACLCANEEAFHFTQSAYNFSDVFAF